MQEVLYRYNPWWEGEFEEKGLVERESMLSLMQRHLRPPQIVFLTGIRRVGKTILLKLFIHYLIKKEGVPPRHLFYVSLDDYQLSKYTILSLVEEFRKLHKIRFKEKLYLFLDEITYQKDFELQLKNLYDAHNVKIYASSSSASIMKSKKPYLTGRNVILEMLPLDFREYLAFKNISLKKEDTHLVDSYFEDFMKTGGMPEFVIRGDVEYIKELVDDIVRKDIASVHRIKNLQVLKDYFILLMERAGKVISINKIANILKISPDTSRRYFEMFVDVYLIYPVSRCGKTTERLLSPKKIYSADLGIRTFFTGFRDKGSLFENYVYLKIRHMNPCYIYEEENEIDFLTSNSILIEVKYYDEMTDRQKRLFERIKAKQKEVLKNNSDLEKFLTQQ